MFTLSHCNNNKNDLVFFLSQGTREAQTWACNIKNLVKLRQRSVGGILANITADPCKTLVGGERFVFLCSFIFATDCFTQATDTLIWPI